MRVNWSYENASTRKTLKTPILQKKAPVVYIGTMKFLKWVGKKLYSVIDKVVGQQNLEEAWGKVRKNKGAPGVDKTTIEEYERELKQNLGNLRTKVLSKVYIPSPIRRVWIPKSNGEKRPLGIPTIEDRVLHMAISQILYTVFEDKFKCFGYVRGVSAKDAIKEIQEWSMKGYRYAVETDIEKFFDNIDHNILINKIHERTTDGTVLRLIRAILRSRVLGETWNYTKKGTPQGSPLSPLLANIYLAELDEIIGGKYKCIRYADDIIVLTKTRKDAEEAKKVIEGELKKLKLKMKESKTRISHISEGWKFLGYEINGRQIKPTQEAVKRLKMKIRKITRRKRTEPVEMIIEEMRPVIIGWTNYYNCSIGCAELFYRLGQWIMDRVKMYIAKAPWIRTIAEIPYKALVEKGLILPYHVLKGYVP